MILDNKTAVVTGGATGIGLAIANALADLDCRTVIAGRREVALKEAASARRDGRELLCHIVDVANRSRVKTLVQWTEERLGPVDILINAAGVNLKSRSMAAMSPEQWDHVMAINATGAYNCMYEVLPRMRERHQGIICNISSISGKRASNLGGIAYCASKFAMTALGTAVGLEEAKHGIRVTNIYPGEVDTPILAHRPAPVSDEHRARMLRPEDVASVVIAIVCLPPHAHVPELVIKPTSQKYA
jgi:NADP-dependent 3-hydroxy acid dehydrogenase YdfG